jgi:uncharacterized protein YydD (DUF2326 family)
MAEITDQSSKKDTHNLGKTSLIHVIDFLMLSKFNKKSVLLSNHFFKGYIFYLEIILNNGKYLVIRRSINQPSKVSFNLSDVPLSDFVPPKDWSEKDLPFEKAKTKLNAYLQFNVLKPWLYRKYVSYFLRTQQDYNDVFQLDKFKGKHSDWKPIVFSLLNFDGTLLEDKAKLEEKIDQEKANISSLQQTANLNNNNRDQILGLLDIKKQEKAEISQSIDKFDFYSQDKEKTKDLVENTDLKIQQLNAIRYRINHDIKKTQESLAAQSSDVDLNKLKELYDEVSLYFPDILKKKFEDLELFNESISNERKKYLQENLASLTTEYQEVDKELNLLEKQKKDILYFLTETDSYVKFKEYQKQLSTVEARIYQLEEQLKVIDKSINLEENVKNISLKLSDITSDIGKAINQRHHAEINKIFNQIITEILGRNAIISLLQNNKGNVEFSATCQNDEQIDTSEANGASYKKLLCMAFDLAILIFYSRQSFFKFVYHDGILEGLDDRVKIRLLDKVKSICSENEIQYVISMIDSDIPKTTTGENYQFEDNEICLRLSDKDDSGKLFKTSF